jgi:hypothetical protein
VHGLFSHLLKIELYSVEDKQFGCELKLEFDW